MDTIIPQKQCPKCKEWKPVTPEFFHVRSESRSGFASHCKQCRNDAQRKYPVLPEGQKRCTKCNQVFPATRQYFRASKGKSDGCKSWCKTCMAANRKPNDKEKDRQYRENHREKMNAASRKHYSGHKEQHRIVTQAWQKAHRDECRAIDRNRHAREKSAQGTHTASDVQRQFERQRGKCYYCKAKVGPKYHVDHVIPLARGGSNGPENLVIACPHCNDSKGARYPHEWSQGGRLM